MMLDRWRSNPISFIETVLYDPETKKPFKLLPAERAFLEHAFKRDDTAACYTRSSSTAAPRKVGRPRSREFMRWRRCCCSAAPIRKQRSAPTIRNKASVACSR